MGIESKGGDLETIRYRAHQGKSISSMVANIMLVPKGMEGEGCVRTSEILTRLT